MAPRTLLTASDDRRTRFWAKHSGATAYVTTVEVSKLIALLEDVPSLVPSSRSFAMREMQGNVVEHLSELLDSALFESTISLLSLAACTKPTPPDPRATPTATTNAATATASATPPATRAADATHADHRARGRQSGASG